MMIFVTDFDMMSHLKLESILMPSSFSYHVYNAQNVTFLSKVISDAVENNENISLALHLVFMSVIVLLLIPIHFILRRRLALHERIFDLMASIDP